MWEKIKKLKEKIIIKDSIKKNNNNTGSISSTYCLGCEKHTNSVASRSVTVTNKVLRQKSRSSECLSDKSRFLKQKYVRRSS